MTWEEMAASLQLLAEEKVGGPMRAHAESEEAIARRADAAILRDIQRGKL